MKSSGEIKLSINEFVYLIIDTVTTQGYIKLEEELLNGFYCSEIKDLFRKVANYAPNWKFKVIRTHKNKNPLYKTFVMKFKIYDENFKGE